MSAAFASAEVEQLRAGPSEFRELRSRSNSNEVSFFRKPSRSLVTTNGSCLSFADGVIRPERCDGGELASGQRWSFSGPELRNSGEGNAQSCVLADNEAPSPLHVAGCSASDSVSDWRFAHVKWSSYGRCVAPRELPFRTGTPLVLEVCEARFDGSQAFWFDIRGSAEDELQARIEFSGEGQSGYCVSVPSAAPASGQVLNLTPCSEESASRQWFDLRRDGTIGFENPMANGGDAQQCLSWMDGSVIYLSPCQASSSLWLVSGALESSSGLAWTLTSDPDVIVEGSQLNMAPAREQTFDFYF
jgi:hypothetical protein